MNTTPTWVALVGNPRPASRTAALAAAVLDAVATSTSPTPGTPRALAGLRPSGYGESGNGDVGGADHHVIDLGAWLADHGAPLGAGSAQRYAEPLSQLRNAALAVIATPVYKGSYPGLLMAFLDHIPAGALRGVVAVPVITIGSQAHTLAGDLHLRPLLLELGATIPTATLVVEEAHLTAPTPLIKAWLDHATGPLRQAVQPLSPTATGAHHAQS